MTRRTWALAGAAVLVAVLVVAFVLVASGADPASGDGDAAPASTAEVQRGKLSAVVAQTGTLTYRARPDGSLYSVINQASGVYTALPASGDDVECGGVLYRVDERPVLLLCGRVPLYRALQVGDAGQDVRQLNRNLRVRGAGGAFTASTAQALRALERRRGLPVNGTLDRADAVFLPEAVRIAKVSGAPGAPARPGARVLGVTSGTLHVRVDFDPSQQGQVKRGDRAQVTLPGSATVTGKVAGFGRIAQAPAGQDDANAAATIPTYVRLDDPSRARGFDRAPVDVQIVTAGVDDALSVPVTALVGRSGGGFAVEAVRGGERRALVAVEVGLFDSAAGRVQVEGELRDGERVVIPSP